HQDRERSRLPAAATGAPGVIDIRHPTGTFALTPASQIALQAIARQRHKLAGIGLDLGCGSGSLAIPAAARPARISIAGLDILAANIAVARSNAALNGVGDKTVFMQSDSYSPYIAADRDALEALVGRITSILATPPASEGDDGFEYRRIVLKGA